MLVLKTPGPLMKEYAACYGCEEKDVLQWVLDYTNGPWPDGMQVEPTEQERLESIKGYIDAMVIDSITRRVKASLPARERIAA